MACSLEYPTSKQQTSLKTGNMLDSTSTWAKNSRLQHRLLSTHSNPPPTRRRCLELASGARSRWLVAVRISWLSARQRSMESWSAKRWRSQCLLPRVKYSVGVMASNSATWMARLFRVQRVKKTTIVRWLRGTRTFPQALTRLSMVLSINKAFHRA